MSEPPKKKKKSGVGQQKLRSEWIAKLHETKKNNKFDAAAVTDFVDNHLKNFENPELFADLLLEIMKEYNRASVPAFNGLLWLLLERNFAVDNLYEEAYKLLTPANCYSDNGQILLEQIDRALTSPYIPKYMLAAFGKRFARLLLFAPVDHTLTILNVLKNICASNVGFFKLMLDRDKPQTLDADPYDERASIASCRAIESSLWELKAIVNHWYSRVSDRSRFVFGNRPEQRVPLISDDTQNAMKRKFASENSSLSQPLPGGRLSALKDLISE